MVIKTNENLINKNKWQDQGQGYHIKFINDVKVILCREDIRKFQPRYANDHELCKYYVIYYEIPTPAHLVAIGQELMKLEVTQ